VATTAELFASLDEAAQRRFLKTLKPPQLEALYRAIVDDEPTDPRQRLLWLAHKELSERFDRWCRTLDCVALSKVYFALNAGTDPATIMAGATN
jgi:hypothetical protein